MPTQPLTSDTEIVLGLPARRENVAVVRQALAGLADALGVEPALAADMKIAITEACTNAVLHAYDEGADGPLEVWFRSGPGRVTIGVRDRGPGFKPLPAAGDESPLGFGLALIASLADAFAIQGSANGTEVQMAFDIDPDALLEGEPPGEGSRAAPLHAPTDAVVLRIPAGALAQAVLGRVVSLLAARVDFSIDRLSDAQIVSDALAQHSPGQAVDGHLAVRIDEHDRCIDIRVGPLESGGGERLVAATALPGVGTLIPELASEYEVEPGAEPGFELLRVRLAEPVA